MYAGSWGSAQTPLGFRPKPRSEGDSGGGSPQRGLGRSPSGDLGGGAPSYVLALATPQARILRYYVHRTFSGTNVDRVLESGFENLCSVPESATTETLLFLFTGEPHNSGCEIQDVIPRALDMMEQRGRRIKIYGLAIGTSADFRLLRKLSAMTGGFARRIYMDEDPASQIRNYCYEAAVPMLSHVQIK